MKYAFLILGDFDSQRDRSSIGGGGIEMIGVASVEEACRMAGELCGQGVDCIELCGAFAESGARKVIEATGNRIPVGFVVHFPEQDELFQKVFG